MLDRDAGALPFVVAAGAHTVPAYRPLREVVLAALWMYGAFAAMYLSDNPGFGSAEFATSVPMLAAVMLVGWSMQQRRLRYDALEREQDQVQLRAAADERLRIAQELHDVIGHSLGAQATWPGKLTKTIQPAGKVQVAGRSPTSPHNAHEV